MAPNQESEEKQVDLRVNPLETPVIGTEIIPDVHLRGANEESLRFQWNRKLNDQKINCCIHYWEKATRECIVCVRLNLPIEATYHCSSKCYKDTWPYHREHHHKAFEQLNGVPEPDADECMKDLENDSLFDGNLGETDPDGTSWLPVGSSKTYIPSNQDFGCFLRLNASVEDCPSASTHVFTDRVIGGPVVPRVRRMIQFDHPMGCSCRMESLVHTPFRVLSYNILADMYTTTLKYSYCPAWALTWDYRKENLLREIIEYDADIICLQEVQTDHFEDFFKPKLEEHGYSVMYKSKKNGLCIGGQNKMDGCATFFRAKKFRVVQWYQLVYSEIAHKKLAALQLIQEGNEYWRLLKDNVAIVAVLEPVEYMTANDNLKSRFCVANTHIYSDESLQDVKLWQVATLINELEKIDDMPIPVLLCGDLNSCPGSAPYDIVRHGKVDTTHCHFPVDDPLGILPHLKCSHGLTLVSAYSTLLTPAGNGQFFAKQREKMNSRTCEPQFTIFSENFSGTLDYIFYSVGKFRVKGLLELLNLEDIQKKSTALPSPEWSSDHIALMAEFCLTLQPQPRNYLSASSSALPHW